MFAAISHIYYTCVLMMLHNDKQDYNCFVCQSCAKDPVYHLILVPPQMTTYV